MKRIPDLQIRCILSILKWFSGMIPYAEGEVVFILICKALHKVFKVYLNGLYVLGLLPDKKSPTKSKEVHG